MNTREDILKRLKTLIKDNRDKLISKELCMVLADKILIDYIADAEIYELYAKLKRWYE